MYPLAGHNDYKLAFRRRFSPRFASQIVEIIDQSAQDALSESERLFKAGNFGVQQGVIRWGLIDDRCQSVQLDGGVIAESRDFKKGRLLVGTEKKNRFVLLHSNEVGALVSKVDKDNPVPKKAHVKKYMSSLPFASTPLYLNMMFKKHMPDELKAIFHITYFLDDEDEENATVDEIKAIVLNKDGKNIYCEVCDLRAYAAEASSPYIYDEPLPLAFRRDYEPTLDIPKDDVTDDLGISMRVDLDDN